MADVERVVSRRSNRGTDEEELAEFGYKQELRRDWGLLHNFGISFSIIVGDSSPLVFWGSASGKMISENPHSCVEKSN